MNLNKDNILFNKRFLISIFIIGLVSFAIYYYIFTNVPSSQQGPHNGLFWAIGSAIIGVSIVIISIQQTNIKKELNNTQEQLYKQVRKTGGTLYFSPLFILLTNR